MAESGNKYPREVRVRGLMSAYAYFVQETHRDLKKEHPNESIVFSEFSTKCSDTWKKMKESDKKKYFQMAEEDQKRFDNEKDRYLQMAEDDQRRYDMADRQSEL